MGFWGNRLLILSAQRLLLVAVLMLTGIATDSGVRQRYPEDDMGRDALPARKKAQIEAAKQFNVFYQFQFTDRLKKSGITFSHHAVDDVTKHMRMGHYDHGSAVAVADVDGDGLYDIYFVNQVGGNELWRNLGGGKFKNITQEAGVGLPGRVSVAAAFADIDNGGNQDLFVTTVRGGNVLFKTTATGTSRTSPRKQVWDWSLILQAHSSSTTTTTACWIFWSATSASTPTTTRDRTASTSAYPMPLMVTCTRTVTNIPCSTRTWATTGSRT